MTEDRDHPWSDDPFELTGTEPWLSTEAALEEADLTCDPDPKATSDITRLAPDSAPGKY